MKPKILLRMATLFMLLHIMGHTIGALTWKNAPNASVGRVIAGMVSNRFDFMGQSVSLALFFEGYGITMIFVLLLVTICLWLLSGDTVSRLAHRLMVVLAVFFLAMSITEYIYFFALPGTLSLLAGICCFSAYLQKKANN